MTARPAKRQDDDALVVPWDLGEWVDKAQLAGWIVADVETLNWTNPELVAYLERQPDYQPKLMLVLMTYAYATGMFDSGEVGEAARLDPLMRPICAGRRVSANEVRKFRRDNRGLFKWTLTQLITKALRAKCALGDRLLPAGLRRHLVESAIARLDLARAMDHGMEMS